MELEISWVDMECSLRPTARVMGSSSAAGYQRRLAKLHSVLASACRDRAGQAGGRARCRPQRLHGCNLS